MKAILKIYGKSDRDAWNKCVKSYKSWDIYYLYEYAYSFMLHGDGEPYLISFERGRERFCFVIMENDISHFKAFEGELEEGKYYDWETPYGYGGPLCDIDISEESQEAFLCELKKYCRSKNVVSLFVRFHPLLENFKTLPKVFETRYLRDTIAIDTTDEELIMKNMDTKNRNMVRKAVKSGVTVEAVTVEDYKDFVAMYNATMAMHQADEYYTFDDEYFKAQDILSDNAKIFYAMHAGKPICGAIMYFNDQFMHYHLSGSNLEYRRYSPNNLLLYEAARWAHERGIRRLHLGGGMSPEDSLFGFKKQFNKNGRCPFVVGRTIFDETAYKELLGIRKKLDVSFDENNNFMIQYRR